MKLTEVKKGIRVTGLEGNTAAEIVSVDTFSDNFISVVYRNGEGVLRERIW